MATPKTSQLANLAGQFPAMAQRGQQVQQSAAQVAAAQAVRQQAATGQRISGAEMGAQLYTGQAAAAREAGQKVQRGAMQVGQMQLQEDAMQKQQILSDRQLGQQQQLRKHEQMLSELNNDVKSKLYDKAMQFQKDELGRTKWQTSQLLDYAGKKSKRWQDYRQTEQKLGQVQKRRMTLLKVAQAQIEQAMSQEFQKSEATANRALQDRLARAQAEMKRRVAEAEARAKEEGAMWEAIGAGIGAVASFIPGAAPFAPWLISGGAALGRGLAPKAESAKMSPEQIRAIVRRK